MIVTIITNKRRITNKILKRIENEIPKRYLAKFTGISQQEKIESLNSLREDIMGYWRVDRDERQIHFSDLGDWMAAHLEMTITFDAEKFALVPEYSKPIEDAITYEDLIIGFIASDLFQNFFLEKIQFMSFCPVCEGLFSRDRTNKIVCSEQCRKARFKGIKVAKQKGIAANEP